MIISLCIPCVDKHIPLLKNLLNTFEKFSRKPDNIIISLSPRYLKINLNNEKIFLEKTYSNVKVIVQKNRTNSAMNKNFASELVEEGIISFIDADDIIHPQRFELIEYVFNIKPNTRMLLHNLISTNKSRDYSLKQFEPIDINKIFLYNDLESQKLGVVSKKYEEREKKIFGHNYCCGPVTIHKDVIKKIKFKDISYAEDAIFVTDVNREYNGDCVYINPKLMDYIRSGSY